MREIAIQTIKNAQRHFIVWGLLASIIMYAGIEENQNGTMRFDHGVAEGTYEDVLSKHKCEAPAEGEFPTGVIAREIGGGFIFTDKPAHIGKALDEAIAGKDWHGFTARQFCK